MNVLKEFEPLAGECGLISKPHEAKPQAAASQVNTASSEPASGNVRQGDISFPHNPQGGEATARVSCCVSSGDGEAGHVVTADKGGASRQDGEAELQTGSSEAKPRYPGAFSSDEPTPYERSGHSSSAEALLAKEHPDSLRNPRDPYYFIKHEKSVHRMMAYMSVRGDTNKEIAEETGYSAVAVSNILRQPSTQVLIAEETKRLGGQEVTVVLRGKAMAAVQRLSKELDNENTGSSQSRIAAANAILDRVFGKPNQPITHHEGSNLDELTDDEIAKRLDELKLQKQN